MANQQQGQQQQGQDVDMGGDDKSASGMDDTRGMRGDERQDNAGMKGEDTRRM